MSRKRIAGLVVLAFIMGAVIAAMIVGLTGCSGTQTGDEKQNAAQAALDKAAVDAVGMPSIKNFREKKLLKDIYELRDQSLATYTYLENVVPTVVPGRTALGGKLTYLGESVGFGIPYATQYTAPQKVDGTSSSYVAIPQADPNDLFSPAAAEGTWVMLRDPNPDKSANKGLCVTYEESRIDVYPYKFAFDK